MAAKPSGVVPYWRQWPGVWTFRIFDFLWLYQKRFLVVAHFSYGISYVRRYFLRSITNGSTGIMGITLGRGGGRYIHGI